MQACSSLQFLTVWAQKHMFTHVIAQEERCGCWATCLQTVRLGELGAVAIVCSHHKQLHAGTPSISCSFWEVSVGLQDLGFLAGGQSCRIPMPGKPCE